MININMTGGLLQVVTYGTQDLFLTGTPEITYFKTVYRRHTNFAMESIDVQFDDPVGFDKTCNVVVPKVGDMVHKIYVKMTLPDILLLRIAPNTGAASTALANAITNYTKVIQFMAVNIQAVRDAHTQFIALNTTVLDMVNAVVVDFAGKDPVVNAFNAVLVGTPYQNVTSTINANIIANSFVTLNPAPPPILIATTSDKNLVMNSLNAAVAISQVVQKYFYDQILIAEAAVQEDTNTTAKFAWVQRVGHALMDTIEVSIGGDVIDRHYGDWLNIWYELTGNSFMDEIYNKMIGNVAKLTTPDRTEKSSYILYVPLQFWFCRYNGLAIPLISLEYHDVGIAIKFRKFQECCYLGDTPTTIIKIPVKGGNITLNNLADYIDTTGNDLEASLLIDYIYLDVQERKKFAQSSHEYLIDQLQLDSMENLVQETIQRELNFNHPCKEMVWVAQEVDYTLNTTGFTQLFWHLYSSNLGVNNPVDPIIKSSINLNSYVRVAPLESNYFNYVQPLSVHKKAPSVGVNMYSFSLYPEEFQPSGACNMSRISRILLTMTINHALFAANKAYNVRVYATNYNILRFASGFGALSFTL